MTMVSRRQFITGASAMTASISAFDGPALSAAAGNQFDFSKPLEGWEPISGQWTIQSVAGASYRDVRVSVRFRPISGREDASGGIVFRFSEGRYYLVRANALEDNFRLYYFDRGRRMLSTTSIKTPALGQWHQLQITAQGDRIQGWLNEQALIDERDARFASGRIGLWTKADSITAFDELTVVPMNN